MLRRNYYKELFLIRKYYRRLGFNREYKKKQSRQYINYDRELLKERKQRIDSEFDIDCS